jgi:hypothetical protein
MRTVDPHDMIVWIEEAEGCGTTPIPSNINGMSCCCAIVVNFKLISVRMTVELSL